MDEAERKKAVADIVARYFPTVKSGVTKEEVARSVFDGVGEPDERPTISRGFKLKLNSVVSALESAGVPSGVVELQQLVYAAIGFKLSAKAKRTGPLSQVFDGLGPRLAGIAERAKTPVDDSDVPRSERVAKVKQAIFDIKVVTPNAITDMMAAAMGAGGYSIGIIEEACDADKPLFRSIKYLLDNRPEATGKALIRKMEKHEKIAREIASAVAPLIAKADATPAEIVEAAVKAGANDFMQIHDALSKTEFYKGNWRGMRDYFNSKMEAAAKPAKPVAAQAEPGKKVEIALPKSAVPKRVAEGLQSAAGRGKDEERLGERLESILGSIEEIQVIYTTQGSEFGRNYNLKRRNLRELEAEKAELEDGIRKIEEQIRKIEAGATVRKVAKEAQKGFEVVYQTVENDKKELSQLKPRITALQIEIMNLLDGRVDALRAEKELVVEKIAEWQGFRSEILASHHPQKNIMAEQVDSGGTAKLQQWLEETVESLESAQKKLGELKASLAPEQKTEDEFGMFQNQQISLSLGVQMGRDWEAAVLQKLVVTNAPGSVRIGGNVAAFAAAAGLNPQALTPEKKLGALDEIAQALFELRKVPNQRLTERDKAFGAEFARICKIVEQSAGPNTRMPFAARLIEIRATIKQKGDAAKAAKQKA